MKHPVIYYAVLGILVFIIGMMLGILTGCASHHTLTPAQIATTRPITYPLTNIQTVIAHTQKTLEPINIIAFLAALAGLGDDLAALDRLAALDVELAVVGVGGDEAVGVADQH